VTNLELRDPSTLRFVTVRRRAVRRCRSLCRGASSLFGGTRQFHCHQFCWYAEPNSSAFPKTREGAADFARYYFDVLNVAESSGAITGLQRLSTRLASTARTSSISSPFLRQRSRLQVALCIWLQRSPAFHGDRAVVTLVVNQDPGTVLDRQGRFVSRSTVEQSRCRLGLRWVGTDWLATRSRSFSGAPMKRSGVLRAFHSLCRSHGHVAISRSDGERK